MIKLTYGYNHEPKCKMPNHGQLVRVELQDGSTQLATYDIYGVFCRHKNYGIYRNVAAWEPINTNNK